MRFFAKVGSKKINWKFFCSCCSREKLEIDDKPSGEVIIKAEPAKCPGLATTVVKAAVMTAVTLV